VCRVGDHHVGFGYLSHHALARCCALLRPDGRFHVRIAFGLFQFALHVFARHAQIARVLPELQGYIDCRDRTHHRSNAEDAQHHEPRGRSERGLERLSGQLEHQVFRSPENPGRDATDERRFEQRFAELRNSTDGKHAGEAGNRVDTRELRQDCGRRERPASDRHWRDESRDDGDRQEWRNDE
jgi:hypothetical protein